MKIKAGLLLAGLLVIAANVFLLAHAALNRAGNPDAEVELTDRELTYWRRSEDTGVLLSMVCQNLSGYHIYPLNYTDSSELVNWFDRAKLEEIGFDCSAPETDPKSYDHYSRMLPRRAYAALEYDGEGWQRLLRAHEEAAARNPTPQYPGAPKPQEVLEQQRRTASRLVAIDAAGDAAVLRSRHPDRSNVIIVPAIVRINLLHAEVATQDRPARPARLRGWISEVPTRIHVPLPYSEGFRRLLVTSRDLKSEKPLYKVRLRFGRHHEPWVIAAAFP